MADRLEDLPAEVQRLREENARLREALEPFARYVRWLDGGEYMGFEDHQPLLGPVICFEREMTLGDCRKAVEVLRESVD